MVMGLSITGFAADNTNVSVSVPGEYDAVYKVQIVEPDTSSTDGWKYVDAYKSMFSDITIDALTAMATAEENFEANTDKKNNYFATEGDINNTEAYTSSQVAEKLESLREVIQNDSNKVVGNSFTASEGGLYVILPVKENYTYSPTLVYVPVNFTTPISVKAKGESDQVTKTLVNVTEGQIGGEGYIDGDDSVTANDTVEYKVTMKYPYFSDGATNKTFKIKDTLTNGTFINNTVKVKVNGEAAAADSYTVTQIINEQTTEITITFLPDKYNSALAGDDVEITYSVKVDADVTSENLFSNKVVSTIGTNSTQSIVKSDTVAVEFDKVNGSGDTLIGAVFALYEKGTQDDKLIACIADAAESDNVTVPEEYEDAMLVKDGTADGTLKYDGLDANKSYYVQEIVAPDGYSRVDTEFDLVPGGKVDGYPNTVTEEDSNGIMTKTTEYRYNDFTVADENEGNGIVNTTLSALPSTGGMGTTIFTIAGCVIMISAAGLFFASRRKAN